MSFLRKALYAGILIGLVGVCAAPAQPQNTSGDAAGQPSRILLPSAVVGGEQATLAVVDAGGHLLPGATVEVTGAGELKTDPAGRATFKVPVDASALSASLKSGDLVASATVVHSHIPGKVAGIGAPQITYVQKVIALSDPFEIAGIGFEGDASQDHVSIGTAPALVLASSPVALVVLPGRQSPPGNVQLLLSVKVQQVASIPTTVIAIDLAGPQNPFAAGNTTQFVVRITGSDKPVLVQVNNSTPDVIDLPGGNSRRLLTSGGAPNSVSLPATSLRAGDYSVSARLFTLKPGPPDEDTARLELIGARGVADARWQKNIDALLALLRRRPEELVRLRRELSKQLKERPPSRIEESLRVAERLLASS